MGAAADRGGPQDAAPEPPSRPGACQPALDRSDRAPGSSVTSSTPRSSRPLGKRSERSWAPAKPALSSATNCRDRSLASSIHVDEQVKGAQRGERYVKRSGDTGDRDQSDLGYVS